MTTAYSPRRDPIAKLARRATQWTHAAPAQIALERPMLSVCFDDFPRSAALAGAAILEAANARATYYAAASLEGKEGPHGRNFMREDLVRLARAGHEIGCHTYSHGDAARAPIDETLADCERNAHALAALGLASTPTSLAFPYGETQVALKRALAPRFSLARGTAPGLNIGRVDRMHLRACSFFGDDADERRAGMLEAAARKKAWLIFFTHDVTEAPSAWGATIGALTRMLDRANALGFVIEPMARAAAHAFKEPACAA